MIDLRDKLANVIESSDHLSHKQQADAVIVAMRNQVLPLVWEGVEADCFVICELDGRSYELCVVDTLERPCDYLWSVTYYSGRQGTRITCGKRATFGAAKAAAHAHHAATIMHAFGINA